MKRNGKRKKRSGGKKRKSGKKRNGKRKGFISKLRNFLDYNDLYFYMQGCIKWLG